MRAFVVFFGVLFGVLLPLVALLIELSSGMCAEEFFDPIPTPWHALLVGLVPLANLLLLLVPTSGHDRLVGWVARLHGVALGVAAVYSLVFLPLVPLALIAVLLVGLGLLPLAPACALVCGICTRLELQFVDGKRLPRLLVWMPVGVLLLLLAETPGPLTHVGVAMASSSPSIRASGLDGLRRFGSRDALLRLCHHDSRQLNLTGVTMNLVAPVTREQARAAFFRVTGVPAAAFPPVRRGMRLRFPDVRDFDPDLGGTTVGSQVPGLSLSSSVLEGTIEEKAGLGYVEWTLVFRNDSQEGQAEARAEIELPSGGVVSRLTLWVNDEPREATFAGTAQVRAAYESVVRQRRDPVLVTATGPDHVLVQCFPVGSRGGQMQVRLGITAPVAPQGPAQAGLRLPRFAQRNFAIPDDLRHDVRLSGPQPLVRKVREEDLSNPAGVVAGGRFPSDPVWAMNPVDPGKAIVQEVRPARSEAVRRLVVVVDGSAGMRDALPAIADALARIPDDVELRLLVASDRVLELSDAARLRRLKAVGGCDNVPALIQGCGLAADVVPSALVWVHAAQPAIFDPVEPLYERLAHLPAGVRFHDVSVAPGPNRILAGVNALVQTSLRRGSLKDDLGQLFADLISTANTLEVVRRVVPLDEVSGETASMVSDKLVRLWAHDEVQQRCRSDSAGDREAAAKLGERYRLVTSVSGAVVLETRQQYERAGLKRAEDEEADSTPRSRSHGAEPGLLLLLFAATLAVLGGWQMRRRSCAA